MLYGANQSIRYYYSGGRFFSPPLVRELERSGNSFIFISKKEFIWQQPEARFFRQVFCEMRSKRKPKYTPFFNSYQQAFSLYYKSPNTGVNEAAEMGKKEAIETD